jgi:predicted PurR-regulated permease PerM
MKQRLEDFINSNRKSFDDENPASPVWDAIQKNIAPQKKATKTIYMPVLKVFAAALIILIAGTVIFLISENNKLKNDLTASQQRLEQQLKQQQQQNPTDYNKELNQIIQVVVAKQNQLSGIGREYPSLYRSFTADIKDLNKEYEELKQVLVTVPEKEEVLDAMMQNLKLQAELLNEQLLIIHQLKSAKKNTNEKATPVI